MSESAMWALEGCKRYWWIFLLAAVFWVAQACEAAWAEEPNTVALAAIPQGPDSVRFVISWTQVDDRRGNPVNVYEWELRDVVGDSLIETQTVQDQTADTTQPVAVLPGDSITVMAQVRGVDELGKEGQWGASSDFVYSVPDLLGPPPPTVNVDTMASMLVIDSVVIQTFGGARGVTIPPGGDTTFAAVLWSGSSAVECCCSMISDPPGSHPCDEVTLVGLGGMVPGNSVPYRRALNFRMYGDSAGYGLVTMRSRGMFMLPELWLEQRRTFAAVRAYGKTFGL